MGLPQACVEKVVYVVEKMPLRQKVQGAAVTKGFIRMDFFENGATVNNASYCQNSPYLLNDLRIF